MLTALRCGRHRLGTVRGLASALRNVTVVDGKESAQRVLDQVDGPSSS